MDRRVVALLLAVGCWLCVDIAWSASLDVQWNPPEKIQVDRPFNVEVDIEQGRSKIDYAIVYYRNLLRSSWKTTFLKKRDRRKWVAVIPGQHVSKPGLEIYGVAFDVKGKKLELIHSEQEPRMLLVVDSIAATAKLKTKPIADGKGEPVKRAEEKEEWYEDEETDEEEDFEQAEEFEEDETESDLGTEEDELSDDFMLFTAETQAKVTSAAKIEQDISESPSTITVITAEDIRNYGSSSIADVLRTVPGMDFLEISHADKNLNIRGFNREGANKMLVLIDGRSVYVDFFGITFWEALPIPVDEIERIEIIRGPGSALYGANAFSGVISIYTHRPEDLKGMLYSIEAGPYGSTASAVVGDVHNQIGYKLSASYRRLASFDDIDSDSMESVKGNAFVEYAIAKDFAFSLTVGAQKDKSAALFSQVGPVAPSTTQAYAKLNGQWKGLSVQMFYSYLNVGLDFDFPIPSFVAADPLWFDATRAGDANFETWRQENIVALNIDDPGTIHISSSGHTFDTDILYTHEFGGIDRITAGGNLRLTFLNSPDLVDTDSQRNIYSLYLQNELYPWDWFIFNAGLRWDMLDVDENDPDSGKEIGNLHSFSPRGSFVFIPHKDHVLRLVGGISFRSPTFFESNMKMRLSDLTVTAPLSALNFLGNTGMLPDVSREVPLNFEGNPKLDPETLYSFELGYGGRIAKRVELEANVFFMMSKNMILFEGDPDKLYWALNPFMDADANSQALNPFGFTNDVDANNAGFEIGAKFRITSWLKGFANYSFQHIWVTNEDDLIDNYVKNKNGLIDRLPDTVDFEFGGQVFQNRLFESSGAYSREAMRISADDVSLEDITTVHKENPAHKFNVGLNTSYKGFSANIFGNFVSATKRSNFLSRLAKAQFLTFTYSDSRVGNWVRYEGSGPIAVYTKSKRGDTTIYGVEDIDPYFILNFNASYSLFEGRMELGIAFFDLLHLPSLWQSTSNQGMSLGEKKVYDGRVPYRTASGIASPRYAQYPRTILFGQAVGGETIPTRIYGFIRGKL